MKWSCFYFAKSVQNIDNKERKKEGFIIGKLLLQ